MGENNGIKLEINVAKVGSDYSLPSLLTQLEDSISELIQEQFNDALLLLDGKGSFIRVEERRE